MFSEERIKKIKDFSTVTKITNYCIEKCNISIHNDLNFYSNEDNNNNKYKNTNTNKLSNSLLKNEYPYDMIYLIDTFFDSNESKKEI